MVGYGADVCKNVFCRTKRIWAGLVLPREPNLTKQFFSDSALFQNGQLFWVIIYFLHFENPPPPAGREARGGWCEEVYAVLILSLAP